MSIHIMSFILFNKNGGDWFATIRLLINQISRRHLATSKISYLRLHLIGSELITNTAYGNDTLWLTWIVFNQGTQTRDMNIDSAINIV